MSVEQYICCRVLDDLVYEHIRDYEGQSTSDKDQHDGKNHTERQKLDLIHQLRDHIHAGQMQDGLAIVERLAPDVLKDPHLYFAITKQTFVELLRKGDDVAGLRFSKEKVAPLALDSYPEAYGEFKELLTLFLVPETNKCIPSAALWSPEKRNEIASILTVCVRSSLQVYEGKLPLLICYLICLHNQYKAYQETAPTVPEIKELLSSEKDPSPLSCGGVATFEERHVQWLVQATGIPRDEAVKSLKVTQGNIEAALKNELGRFRLNKKLLRELLLEYSEYRALVCRKRFTDTQQMNRNKYSQKLCDLQQVINQSDFEEIFPLVNTINPSFWKLNPKILFKLRQWEFSSALSRGDYEMAIFIAREHLAPLCRVESSLYAPFKKTLLRLLPASALSSIADVVDISLTSEDLKGTCASLPADVSSSLHDKEPRLLSIFRVLLFSYQRWFELQQMEDPFDNLFGISSLLSFEDKCVTEKTDKPPKVHKPEAPADTGRETNNRTSNDNAAADSGDDMSDSGENSADGDGETVEPTESDILQIMEFLNVTRFDAIRLLGEYGGVLEVFENYFPED
eukprot:Rmarinus@m.16122